MSFATFIASHVLVADYGDWLVEFDLLDPADAAYVARFSSHGTVVTPTAITVDDITIPANTPFRKRLLSAPTWTQSLWSQGTILARSFPNYGSAILNNRDGGLDYLHPRNGWKWVDRRARVYFGPGRKPRSLAADIAKTVDATMDRPLFKLSTVEVPLLGYESRFDQVSSKRVYRGTNYMLSLSGVKQVDYGTPSAVDLTGDMSAEGWLWLNSGMVGSSTPIWGWLGGAAYPWRLTLTSDLKLRLSATIGGTTETVTTAATLDFFGFYHISFDIDGRDVTFTIFNDATLTTTTETFTNAFSNATRDVHSGATYKFGSSDTTLVVFGDEMRVWGESRDSTAHAADRFREFGDDAIPASLVHYARMNDGTGTAVTDSSATAAHGTITGAGIATWLWAYEGTAELAGTPKPDLWGIQFGVAPVLVDHADNGYQIAGDGSIEEIVEVREGGYNNYVYDGDSSSFFNFITAAVANGHVLTYLARGLYRLGASPTLPLSVKAKGYNNGANGYVEAPGDILVDMAQRRGPQLSPASGFDDASIAAFNAAISVPIAGIYLPQPVNLMDVFDTLAKSGAGWWGYLRGATKLRMARYTGPAATADHAFDKRHIVDEPREIAWQPVGEVIVRYHHNDVALTEDQVADEIKGTAAQQRVMAEWLEEKRGEPAAGKRSIVVETALYVQPAAAELADDLYATLQGEKQGWAVTVKADGLIVSMGETVTLAWVDQFGNNRLGLDGSEKYVVLTVADQRQDGKVALEVLSA